VHDNPSDSQGPPQTAGWMCIECPRCGTHLKNYIKITWDELVRCGAWILTAFGRVEATWTVLIFSHFLPLFPLSTRFDQICSFQLPPYPVISCVSIAYPASDRPPSPLQVRLDIEAGTAERLSEVSLCNFCATGLSRDVWGPLEE